MRRCFFFLFTLLCVSGILAQQVRFKAAALNVDGLPPKFDAIVTQIDMNPDGPQEAGTRRMSELISEKGWNILGISEDFNYNDELLSELTDYYDSGTWRGKMEIANGSILELLVHTDGLNFIWQKSLAVGGEQYVRWNKTYGSLKNGFDENIEKGYRYYWVKLDEGMELDVYVLHMDAETDAEDIAARESQLTQLADAIIASHNKRPIIILGDTNCRYTRDKLKELLIDRINADDRFTINDPWVDLQWNGKYPDYGTDAMMTSQYGMQKGEVVDKVFYINNIEANGVTLTANTYLHDTDFTYIDGTPISDHFPVVVDFTINKEWTETITGSYYLQNSMTGLFLKPGGWWGTHAMEGCTGTKVNFNLNSDGTYTLSTALGYLSHNNNDPYMDTSVSDAGTWTVKALNESGDKYVLTYMDGETEMALCTDNSGTVVCLPYDPSSAAQQWSLRSEKTLLGEMRAASQSNPFDATFLLKGANFDRNDSNNGLWQGEPTIGGLDNSANGNFNAEKYNEKKILTSVGWDVNQTINVPNGHYKVSCQAFFRDGDKNTTSDWVNAELYANASVKDVYSILSHAQTNALSQNDYKNESGYIPNDQTSASYYFNAGLYPVSVDVNVTDGTLKLGIRKKESDKKESWTCFDNFQLLYYGPDESEKAVYERVKAAMDDVEQKKNNLTPEAQKAFDNFTVETRYNNHTIVGDGTEEVLYCYKALAAAAIAQTEIGADMTYAVINPGFELGTDLGWTVTPASETLVASQSDSRFTTSGCEGDYLFNTWSATTCPPLEQTVSLRSGVYELKVLVASDAGNKVFLTVDGKHNDGVETVGGGQFVETSMRFIVKNAGAVIGVSGGVGDDYSEEGGCWFKADHFRLTYIGDAVAAQSYDRVKYVLDDVKAKILTLNEEYRTDFDISEIEERYLNFELEGDGEREVLALYGELAKAVKKQHFAGADMTYAIVNNSFETGDDTGWRTIASSDTGVRENSNGTYTTNGCDGDYLYNTWWQGTPISQTITDLPNGKYKLDVLVASDGGRIFLVANGVPNEGNLTTDKTVFLPATITFDVTDGKATIAVVGGSDEATGKVYIPEGYWWYKADHFRLTYLGNELTLDENKATSFEDGYYSKVTLWRHIEANKWSTFVIPFSMDIPEGWEVKELAEETIADDNYLHLRFKDASSIEAGKPYMVRTSEEVSCIEVENVDVTRNTDNVQVGNVSFIGTYVPGFIPQGDYFISNNLFYCAVDQTNSIKGYRAYLSVDQSVQINGIRFHTDDDWVLGMEQSEVSPVTVKEIYNLNGVRLNRLMKGINILKMSDGTVKRVIIKN